MRPTGRPAYHTVFLSTLSLRRATTPNSGRTRNTIISIHALLAESDIFNTCCVKPIHAFLSTLSLRRATMWLFNPSTPTSHFYPRSPCGERRVEPFYTTARFYFYPRSPCGERRSQIFLHRATSYISIHALLAESDRYNIATWMCSTISIHALLAESDCSSILSQ